MHHYNLYDLDEGLHSGDRYDPATGKPIDNSTDTHATQVKDGYIVHEGPTPIADNHEDDDAARWLAENDPDNDRIRS